MWHRISYIRCSTNINTIRHSMPSTRKSNVTVKNIPVAGKSGMVQRRKSERNALKHSEQPTENTSFVKETKKNKKAVQKKVKLSETLNADDILLSSCSNSKSPTYGLNRVKDSYYDVPCEDLAKGLLGQILVRRLSNGKVLKGRIVETECYPGGEDKASATYNGRITEKMKALYMKPGTTFVYLTYGMYHCINISTRGPGAAVLLRGIEPLEGIDYMQEERGKRKKSETKSKEFKLHELCNGPSKLCISFNITKASNEQDLTSWDEMWIEEDDSSSSYQIVTSTRIGIDSAGTQWASKPLRFYVLGSSSVSRKDEAKEKELKNIINS